MLEKVMDWDFLATSYARLGDKRALITALAGTSAFCLLASTYLFKQTPSRPKIFRSPLKDTQSQQQSATCPYPSAALPGARDVSTPYGSIRAYEWGPENGRKVLFVHGISTPCISLASLAQELVEQNGCRVILFDLFGRGYSDAPDPITCPQDSRLWTTQIALVLGSSELDWWAGNVSIVGYSLGGGIAADFASWFPEVVEGLVLIVPSGLLRQERVAWWSKLVYGGFLPRGTVERMVKKRLVGSSSQPQQQPEKTRVGIVQSAEAEEPEGSVEQAAEALFPGRPSFSVATSVEWQVEAHPGFVSSFISSIQNSPISGQQHRWRLIASRLDEQRSSPDEPSLVRNGLREEQVLMLLGKDDGFIVADEVSVDATEVLGKTNVRIEVLAGGHDLPVADPEGCARVIGDFWNWS